MTAHYPRVRVHSRDGVLLIREALSLHFYMRRPHREVASGVLESLELYRRALGEHFLSRYADEAGGWEELDDTAWEQLRREMLDAPGASLDLRETASREKRYRFDYRGCLSGSPSDEPEAVCAVSFWLPTEYLEEHGPEEARELALELAAPLPFSSGHAGLSFNCDLDLVGVEREVKKWSLLHPGLDVPKPDRLAWQLGARVRTVSWLTFLGQPILGELGGAAGLRARIQSWDCQVQDLGGARAVATLGSWPEAGGPGCAELPPSYRELSRILEPWLFHEKSLPGSGLTEEELRRWERRLLD
jgi:hypothetical protein